MHVSGNLTLPSLQMLTLVSEEHATEVLEMSFQKLPKACELRCNSCIHLMDPVACHKRYARLARTITDKDSTALSSEYFLTGNDGHLLHLL